MLALLFLICFFHLSLCFWIIYGDLVAIVDSFSLLYSISSCECIPSFLWNSESKNVKWCYGIYWSNLIWKIHVSSSENVICWSVWVWVLHHIVCICTLYMKLKKKIIDLYHNLFIHFHVSGHLSCIPTAMNVSADVFWCIRAKVSWVQLRVEMLNQEICICSSLQDNTVVKDD